MVNFKLRTMKFKLITALLLIQTSLMAGGPWPQQKGNFYLKLSEWWVVFDEHFTDNGLRDPNITTGIFNTALYGEYGITDRLTGVVNAHLFSRNYTNNLISNTTGETLIQGEALNSIGDIDLSLKYGLTRFGALPVSATLTFGIPTGTTGAGALNNLQTGDGEFNQMLQVDAGSGFNLGSLPAYSSLYVGFNNRTQGFSEELRYGLELGVGLADRSLWLVTKLNVIESLKNGDTIATVNSTSIFANNTEFKSLAFEANYYLSKKVGISASVASALSGSIIAAAPSYSVGVFIDMSK